MTNPSPEEITRARAFAARDFPHPENEDLVQDFCLLARDKDWNKRRWWYELDKFLKRERVQLDDERRAVVCSAGMVAESDLLRDAPDCDQPPPPPANQADAVGAWTQFAECLDSFCAAEWPNESINTALFFHFLIFYEALYASEDKRLAMRRRHGLQKQEVAMMFAPLFDRRWKDHRVKASQALKKARATRRPADGPATEVPPETRAALQHGFEALLRSDRRPDGAPKSKPYSREKSEQQDAVEAMRRRQKLPS